ncbi:hypothetical protein LCM00_15180 [Bacillus infantis]|nr:hypothetical protein [Bacillus infantis]MCA1040857.1 hypothetical protein [Bacillus infantis]
MEMRGKRFFQTTIDLAAIERICELALSIEQKHIYGRVVTRWNREGKT